MLQSINYYLHLLPPWLWITIIIHFGSLGTVAYLILLERKVASWAQDRIGPNRTGLGFGIIPWLKDKKMFGLGQPLADGLKFFVKEDYRPKNVDRILFTLAPMIMITVILISIAVIPWGGIHQHTIPADGPVPYSATIVSQTPSSITYQYPFQIASLNIGVLFVLAFLSLAVYGVVVGGWASNNKYSFLGGLRAAANMISYEVPLGLSVLTIVLMYGSMDLSVITASQAHYWLGFIPAWNIFTQPLTFFMFLICIHAEANRAPFDLAEAEQELVGGYHTEYSSMRFALFFLAEYAGMITTSAVCVCLFFGGWHIPWLDKIPAIAALIPDPSHPAVTTSLPLCIARALCLIVKTIGVLFFFMWVRWSLPRFRFDQLMNLAWRALIPISLLLLLATTLAIYFVGGNDATYRATELINTPLALTLLGANLLVLVISLIASQLLPAPPPTNRKLPVEGSRFNPAPAL
ncbi:MAG TPA: NADH-quinone oxidoreductase subunit NuoH [Tepidisphaeraceae bacterium]|jgi:NADH-quinone oxidoreductase subunit H|nr:NADH-quinone oxidoreductase subunit NuoH [Tepidisphaeraceae bacterium]